MSGGVVFEYKCSDGHKTERRFPPGTAYEKHDSTICRECVDKPGMGVAYLIFAYPEKSSVGS